ncbi:MAG: polysaccharide deacetylase family protein [Sporomusaceae bacterium]|nr:polysaccharide deacetylase family protein [Sporomusaceae bacterium]
MRRVMKKTVNTFIIFSCLLLAAIYVALTYFQGVPVLNYHQINDRDHNALTVSSSEFEAQMAYLADHGYQTITPDELADYLQLGKPLPRKPILITMDDGYEDNYQVAYPILQRYQAKATIFIITDFVGRYDRYLTWEQIAQMSAHDIDFESHTLSHVDLATVSPTEAQKQLTASKAALEWHLGRPVNYLAYPGGEYSQQIIDMTKAAGYRAAFTVHFGRDRIHSTLYTLNRIPIFGGNNHTFWHFWLRLKFTEVFTALGNFKAYLLQEGDQRIAGLIYIP